MIRATLFAVLFCGCATYSSELGRGQAAYEADKHEQALAIFRALEHDQSHFDDRERARYAYLRGMTDQRIGYRADARHWLAVAKEIDVAHPSSLPTDWRKKCDETLAELNEAVWSGGMVALDKPASKTKKSTEDSDKPKAKSGDSEE